jgi:glycosyltransferase involved in cell wall biosynthesis
LEMVIFIIQLILDKRRMTNDSFPLVSIICLCYHHEKFVKEALESVLFQDYPHFEMIVVDDCSQDKSAEVIQTFVNDIKFYKEAYHFDNQAIKNGLQRIEFIQNTQNLGNCQSFNQALQIAQGKYIIDFATDDVLLDDRIRKQVEIFESLPEDYAVVFGNAMEIDESGRMLKYHYPIDKQGQSRWKVPEGNVYKAILERYFICTATMMMRRSVLEELNGYDEELSYEDFDFWVRSSRKYLYAYQDEVTTLKRSVRNSLSTKFYQKNQSPHLLSTLQVLKKAQQLNQSPQEDKALAQCTMYHLKQAFFTQNFDLVQKLYTFLRELAPQKANIFIQLILLGSKMKLKVFWMYKLYYRLRRFKTIKI